jgi:hypothetical protein
MAKCQLGADFELNIYEYSTEFYWQTITFFNEMFFIFKYLYLYCIYSVEKGNPLKI